SRHIEARGVKGREQQRVERLQLVQQSNFCHRIIDICAGESLECCQVSQVVRKSPDVVINVGPLIWVEYEPERGRGENQTVHDQDRGKRTRVVRSRPSLVHFLHLDDRLTLGNSHSGGRGGGNIRRGCTLRSARWCVSVDSRCPSCIWCTP